jgi:hypothetical protein
MEGFPKWPLGIYTGFMRNNMSIFQSNATSKQLLIVQGLLYKEVFEMT